MWATFKYRSLLHRTCSTIDWNVLLEGQRGASALRFPSKQKPIKSSLRGQLSKRSLRDPFGLFNYCEVPLEHFLRSLLLRFITFPLLVYFFAGIGFSNAGETSDAVNHGVWRLLGAMDDPLISKVTQLLARTSGISVYQVMTKFNAIPKKLHLKYRRRIFQITSNLDSSMTEELFKIISQSPLASSTIFNTSRSLVVIFSR